MSTQTPADLAPWQLIGNPGLQAITQIAPTAPTQPIIGWVARAKSTDHIVGASSRRFSVWSSKTWARKSARESHWPRLTEADLNSRYEFLPVTLAP